ncbi:MAG: MBG domain-containing protein [Christensenellales bacterium]|nr:MBG domain-containing protein [Christensenellales bacterium]
MKRKSIITVLALVLVLALSLSIFSACNKNHKYSSEWKFDEKTHWHECTTKKHTDTTEKTPHVFTWTEKTPAGVHTDKVEKGVCECGYETERTISGTATHTYGEEWKNDESGHWHESTCDATAPTHDVMKSDFAAHTFDDGIVTKPADYGVVGEKKFTCTVCEYSYTQEIDALGAKDNTISFANDLVDEKTYDGLAFIIDPAKVNRKGDGEITITYKGENDTAFSETAPINAGEYTVKATVKGTAEWKGGEITTTIIINKREITLPAGVFERKLGENLESGKFGLTCINVAAETNNVVEWVTIGAPETYYAIGIRTISATVLTVDNDNFELNNGVYDTVKFTVWNAPDSFYAGIKDVFTFPGNSDVMINTIIANGTVKKGDQILVNEIGKIITVNKIEKDTGTSVTEVETATAGEEVGLRISEGVTKAELNRGYMLSKPDTIIGYSKVTVTIRVRTKDEGGQNTPIQSGIKPNVAFADTFGEVTGEVTFPEGTTLLSGGEILEGVTINFQGKKVPAFVGRRFTLRVSGKTIAECIVTAVPNATRVRSGFMLGVAGTNVIEPIELGENTFAVNLNRSDLGEMLKNAKDTDTIEIKFINGGKDIAKYTRTPGTGEGVYNEVGGRIVGSYLIVEFYKNTGSDPKLTGNNGEWVFTGDDIYIAIGVYITPASGT